MAETATASSYTEERVTAAARERGEPDWLVDRRAEGARAFAATPMPTPRLRPWKYTDVTALEIDAFALIEGGISVEASAPDGAFAGMIADALGGEHEAALREHLGGLIAATEGKFVAANAAQWRGGVFVHATRAAVFEQPIVIEIDAPVGGAIFPRLLVVAEEQSELTIVLRHRSGDDAVIAPGVIEVFCGAGSNVRMLIDGRWGAETQEFTFARARLDRDAQLQISSIAIGGRLVKQTIESLIEGEGAHSDIRGVALGDGDQRFDFVTLQDHIGPRTTSKVQIKAALAGASKSIYYGVTRVEETAAGSQAEQENRNLLLSRRAKADSDPVLEILTADVIRCGHAATVGPVDQEALFYLQSRGLAYRAALQLLVSGFFSSVVEGIPMAGLEAELAETVSAKLATAEL